jgi:hypothetical protein
MESTTQPAAEVRAPLHSRKTKTASTHPRKVQSPAANASRAKRQRRPTASDPESSRSSFLPIDAELFADLQDTSARKLRAIVRARPLVAVSGALAAGFIVGGGWRTRIGRFMLLAAARYVAMHAASRYFVA